MAKTILIVDDFENSLFVTGVTLQKKGYNVLKANSGNDALKYIDGRRIDLIITDYNMPLMNGLQLVEKIKLDERYLRTPVFVLSTEIKKEIKEKAYNMGVTAWVQKPFKIEELATLADRATK